MAEFQLKVKSIKKRVTNTVARFVYCRMRLISVESILDFKL